jgi:hypothetical protein
VRLRTDQAEETIGDVEWNIGQDRGTSEAMSNPPVTEIRRHSSSLDVERPSSAKAVAPIQSAHQTDFVGQGGFLQLL